MLNEELKLNESVQDSRSAGQGFYFACTYGTEGIISVLTRSWHWTQSTNSLRHIPILSSHSCLGLVQIFQQYLHKIS
jgi:hypothetical protein